MTAGAAGRVKEKGELHRMRSRTDGKRLWEELSEAEHQVYPGDYEAMVSQGAMAKHSEEHLATSDRGIVMLRQMVKREIDKVQRGEDPMIVFRDPDHEVVDTKLAESIRDLGAWRGATPPPPELAQTR